MSIRYDLDWRIARFLLRLFRRHQLVKRVNRLHYAEQQRVFLLAAHEITWVVDVGANIGQYARRLCQAGYHGHILSFEPTRSAFHKLTQTAHADPLWHLVNAAVGDHDGEIALNVTQDSTNSSIFEPLPGHIQTLPEIATVVAVETVPLVTLASALSAHSVSDVALHLKIDVQGAELQVLQGAGDWLSRFATVELELSLFPLYAGQPLYRDLITYLADHSFDLVYVERGYTRRDVHYTMQFDGIFVRRDLVKL